MPKSDWRSRYTAHLASPYWDELRRDVLVRADGRCEVCEEGQITQVHHHHYGNLGHETLFDVVGICGACHMRLHGIKPKRGKRPKRKRPQGKRAKARRKKRQRQPKHFKTGPGLPDNPDWGFRERLLAQFKHD